MKLSKISVLAILAILAILLPTKAYARPTLKIIKDMVSPDRDVYLRGVIDDDTAADVAEKLADFDKDDHKAEIELHITSDGGSVYAGFKIYDAIKGIAAPVRTICEGRCMSMAALILAAGDRRVAQPTATILIHGITTGEIGGKLPIVDNQVKEDHRIEDTMNELLARAMHKTVNEVKALEGYDHFIPAEEALKDGLIDEIERPAKGKG